MRFTLLLFAATTIMTVPRPALADCGDGILDTGEICDDGNQFAADGCRGDCLLIERGWQCFTPGEMCVFGCGDCEQLATDDFDGASLDSTLWRSDTTNTNAAIAVGGGFVELTNRALVVSMAEYEPRLTGGLSLSVRWVATAGDRLSVMFRAGDTPSLTSPHDGLPAERIEAFADAETGQVGVLEADLSGPTTALAIAAGDNVLLELTDDGFNIELAVTNETASLTATVMVTSRTRSATDYVVLANRGRGAGDFVSTVDSVEVRTLNVSPCFTRDCDLDLIECADVREAIGTACDDNDPETLRDVCTGAGICEGQLCGNGEMDGREECDDGNFIDDDGCDSNCTLPACGNGIINPSIDEECDDGDAIDDDGCDTNCTRPACGNGIINPSLGETCDDTTQTADCDADCTAPACGDGEFNPEAEDCDDGGLTATCDDDCTVPMCGDGIWNAAAGEDCDDGDEVDTGNGCTDVCARNDVCGNTTTEALFEECDDGNAVEDDGCDTNCTFPSCGNGIVDPSLTETCDDAGDSATCDGDCTAPSCGDGYPNAAFGEACDAAGESTTCDVDCTDATCGDGTVNTTAGEGCDDANTTNGDGCAGDCSGFETGWDCTGACFAICGDGMMVGSEGCDDGAAGNSDTAVDACRTNCQPAGCGDGVLDTGETCDDGAANSASMPDACRPTCLPATCGDGTADTGEECDDGDRSNSDFCLETCRLAFCGDGEVFSGREECDEGAANSDTAPNSCRLSCRAPRCGDAVLDASEECDDGNLVSSDGCSSSCRAEVEPPPPEEPDEGCAAAIPAALWPLGAIGVVRRRRRKRQQDATR